MLLDWATLYSSTHPKSRPNRVDTAEYRGLSAATSYVMRQWVASGQAIRSTGAFPHSGVGYAIINGANRSSGTL
jgi:hypothetical protein